MKYKMVVSDFDGTIYRSDYTISQRTRDAINQYTAKGGRMVIATGRLYQAIAPHAKSLGLHGEVITYQGGGVFDLDTDKQNFGIDIDNAVAIRVYEKMVNEYKDRCIPILFYDDDSYIKCQDPSSDLFAKIVKVQLRYTGIELDEYVKENKLNPSKILALTFPQTIGEFVDDFRKDFGDYLNINRSGPTLVEMVNKDASKGNAVKWLAQANNISQEEIICIGDAENDNSMIEYAGLGVAVANAMDVTKAVADYICPSNDDDGVADTIERFCLSKE